MGRAAPYGVYDPVRNEGHVCVTMSSDTADFAVDALRDWWRLNQPHDPQAKRLMIEADGGGSNGARSRRYKKGVQDFADETGLKVTATYFDRTYQTKLKVTNAEFKTIQRTRHEVCPQWNDTIRPHPKNTE